MVQPRSQRRGLGTFETLVSMGLLLTLGNLLGASLGQARSQLTRELEIERLDNLAQDLSLWIQEIPPAELGLTLPPGRATSNFHRSLGTKHPETGLLTGWRGLDRVQTQVTRSPLGFVPGDLVEIQAWLKRPQGAPVRIRRQAWIGRTS